MIAWLIARFGEKAVRRYGPWALVGLIFLVVGAMFTGAYLVGRSDGAEKWEQKHAAAVQEAAQARSERDTAQRQRDTAEAAAAACSAATEAFERESEARVSRLEAELARKPRTIIEYREREGTVDQVVTATDCGEALAQVASVLEGVEPPHD